MMKHKNIKIRRNGSLTIKQVLAKELKGTRFLFAKPRVLLLTNDVRHETSNQRTDHRLIMEKWVGFLNNTIARESLDTLENIIGRDVIGFKYLVEAKQEFQKEFDLTHLMLTPLGLLDAEVKLPKNILDDFNVRTTNLFEIGRVLQDLKLLDTPRKYEFITPYVVPYTPPNQSQGVEYRLDVSSFDYIIFAVFSADLGYMFHKLFDYRVPMTMDKQYYFLLDTTRDESTEKSKPTFDVFIEHGNGKNDVFKEQVLATIPFSFLQKTKEIWYSSATMDLYQRLLVLAKLMVTNTDISKKIEPLSGFSFDLKENLNNQLSKQVADARLVIATKVTDGLISYIVWDELAKKSSDPSAVQYAGMYFKETKETTSPASIKIGYLRDKYQKLGINGFKQWFIKNDAFFKDPSMDLVGIEQKGIEAMVDAISSDEYFERGTQWNILRELLRLGEQKSFKGWELRIAQKADKELYEDISLRNTHTNNAFFQPVLAKSPDVVGEMYNTFTLYRYDMKALEDSQKDTPIFSFVGRLFPNDSDENTRKENYRKGKVKELVEGFILLEQVEKAFESCNKHLRNADTPNIVTFGASQATFNKMMELTTEFTRNGAQKLEEYILNDMTFFKKGNERFFVPSMQAIAKGLYFGESGTNAKEYLTPIINIVSDTQNIQGKIRFLKDLGVSMSRDDVLGYEGMAGKTSMTFRVSFFFFRQKGVKTIIDALKTYFCKEGVDTTPIQAPTEQNKKTPTEEEQKIALTATKVIPAVKRLKELQALAENLSDMGILKSNNSKSLNKVGVNVDKNLQLTQSLKSLFNIGKPIEGIEIPIDEWDPKVIAELIEHCFEVKVDSTQGVVVTLKDKIWDDTFATSKAPLESNQPRLNINITKTRYTPAKWREIQNLAKLFPSIVTSEDAKMQFDNSNQYSFVIDVRELNAFQGGYGQAIAKLKDALGPTWGTSTEITSTETALPKKMPRIEGGPEWAVFKTVDGHYLDQNTFDFRQSVYKEVLEGIEYYQKWDAIAKSLSNIEIDAGVVANESIQKAKDPRYESVFKPKLNQILGWIRDGDLQSLKDEIFKNENYNLELYNTFAPPTRNLPYKLLRDLPSKNTRSDFNICIVQNYDKDRYAKICEGSLKPLGQPFQQMIPIEVKLGRQKYMKFVLANILLNRLGDEAETKIRSIFGGMVSTYTETIRDVKVQTTPTPSQTEPSEGAIIVPQIPEGDKAPKDPAKNKAYVVDRFANVIEYFSKITDAIDFISPEPPPPRNQPNRPYRLVIQSSDITDNIALEKYLKLFQSKDKDKETFKQDLLQQDDLFDSKGDFTDDGVLTLTAFGSWVKDKYPSGTRVDLKLHIPMYESWQKGKSKKLWENTLKPALKDRVDNLYGYIEYPKGEQTQVLFKIPLNVFNQILVDDPDFLSTVISSVLTG